MPIGTTEVVLPLDVGIVEGVSLAANGTLAFAAALAGREPVGRRHLRDGRGGEPVRLTDDESTRNTHADYSRDGRLAYLQVPDRLAAVACG